MQAQRFLHFLIANWVLISFLSALLIAVYVKFRFGVDYFENYRNISTTKELSRFHQQMGDRMMAASEWQAAEEAYRAALQVSSNNMAATFGIVKAQVFQPLPGQKFFAPEIVDAKLDYLLSRFPNDDQVYFLKGLRVQQTGDDKQAIAWLQKCLVRNPASVAAYLQLGTIYFGQSDIKNATDSFAKAVQLDPNSAMAKNNLAACHMLMADFPGAVKEFEASFRISQSPLTAITLGEACWFSKEFDRALSLHQFALQYVQTHTDDNDRYLAGGWTSGFMPLQKGDLETIKTCVNVYTHEQMEAMAHISVCIDQALLGNLELAAQEFDACWKLEHGPDYRRLFQNRMHSVENMVAMPDASRAWLAERRKMLD